MLAGPHWRLRAAVLQHHGPCLGFALEERCHVNVWRNRVEEAGLGVGVWLKPLKSAVRGGLPDDTPMTLPDGRIADLGSLRALVSVARGQKIGYVTDVSDTPSNRAKIVSLCRDADLMFIEASFAAADAERAAARAHLTTRAAGEIGKACGARRLELFHFSPRHEGQEEQMLAEVDAAFGGP